MVFSVFTRRVRNVVKIYKGISVKNKRLKKNRVEVNIRLGKCYRLYKRFFKLDKIVKLVNIVRLSWNQRVNRI